MLHFDDKRDGHFARLNGDSVKVSMLAAGWKGRSPEREKHFCEFVVGLKTTQDA